jgi:ribonuclease P protein component
VLPAERRVRRREDFTAAVRHGKRVGASGLTVHVTTESVAPTGSQPARAGFIVGRVVGSAVTRNRVRRRLRHLLAPRLDRLPAGTVVIVRAGAPAAQRSGRELGATLDLLLERALSANRSRSAVAPR